MTEKSVATTTTTTGARKSKSRTIHNQQMTDTVVMKNTVPKNNLVQQQTRIPAERVAVVPSVLVAPAAAVLDKERPLLQGNGFPASLRHESARTEERNDNAVDLLKRRSRQNTNIMAAAAGDGNAAGFETKQSAIETVTQNGFALRFAPDCYKNDKQVVLAAVKEYGIALRFASPELQKDVDVILAAVTNNGYALGFVPLPTRFQLNKHVILAAVQNYGLALRFLTTTTTTTTMKTNENVNFAGNKKIVMTAISQNGLALEFASESLRNDKEIVLQAISNNENAIQFASDRLRADKDVIRLAVSKNPNMLKYALDGFNQDRDCWIAAGLWNKNNNNDNDNDDNKNIATAEENHAKVYGQSKQSNMKQQQQVDMSIKGCTSSRNNDHVNNNTTTTKKSIKVVLSTKFSLHETSTSTVTTFTKVLNEHPYFRDNGNFEVYSPNAFCKDTCDPNWTRMDWPCRGTFETCQKPSIFKPTVTATTTATGTEKIPAKPNANCCWRYSFRYHLQKAKDTSGFMIQVVDLKGEPRTYESSFVSEYQLGDGQQIETVMAKDVGTKIFRIYRPRILNCYGGQYLQDFNKTHIDKLVSHIESWYKKKEKKNNHNDNNNNNNHANVVSSVGVGTIATRDGTTKNFISTNDDDENDDDSISEINLTFTTGHNYIYI